MLKLNKRLDSINKSCKFVRNKIRMRKQYERALVKKLTKFCERYNFVNIKETKGLLVADCEYYSIALYTCKYTEYILVYFIDANSRQIITKYRTRTIFINNILARIQSIHKRIITRKNNLYT